MKVYFIHRRLLLGLISGVLPNLLKSSICEHSIFCLLPFSCYLSEELMPYSGIRASQRKLLSELGRKHFRKRCDVVGGVLNMTSHFVYV